MIKTLVKNKKATEIVEMAQSGDVEVLAQLKKLEVQAKLGDPEAIKALESIRAARHGQKLLTAKDDSEEKEKY
jgi:hypothetical protein